MDQKDESERLADYVLCYHKAMIEVAKDRTHGSMVKSAKLDQLYERMVRLAREVLDQFAGDAR